MAGKKNYSLTEAWRTSVHLFFSCLSCRLLLLFARKEFREWKKRRLAEVVILFCSAPALCQWDQIGPEASSPTFHLKSQLERHADLVSSVFHGNIWIFFQGFFLLLFSTKTSFIYNASFLMESASISAEILVAQWCGYLDSHQ